MGDRQDGGRGNGRINRVSTISKDARTRKGCQGISGCHRASPANHHRSHLAHESFLSQINGSSGRWESPGRIAPV
jgi:hypothetical protein